MSETALKLGDLVWAKMKGFSPWPGKIANPPKDLKRISKPSGKTASCVFFFGTDNFAWIEDFNIKPYHEYKEQFTKACKSRAFLDACQAIEKHIVNPPKEEEQVQTVTDDNQSDEDFDKLKDETKEKDSPKKVKRDIKRTPKERKRRTSGESGSDSGPTPSRKKPRSNSTIENSSDTSVITNHTSPRKSGLVSRILDQPATIQRPDTPPLDVERVTQTLKEKNVQPSTLKFGFLGLGIMGSGMVKNLLNSGHKVIVWNRTTEKCQDFVKAGAEEALTPSDVISAADITFSCVSDPQVAKDMVFGNCGVLQEMSADKGFVEMTGIDAETSQDIAEAITGKGGRYLEAQIQGSKVQAEEGMLVILAAGDRTLFDDCQSCFQAMGKNSFFLGEVGSASKMNLVLQLMMGVAVAGVAEGMALADRAGLQQRDVLEIFELTTLACPLLLEKGKAILEGAFPTNLPLQHMQKDLKLSLSMGDQLEQPLPVSAAANEVYKHAKRLGYADHDVSAVYIRARF
ncbi:putative oxidoreductase GLYR1 homolog [Daphnia pulicaria]|uniref:putative oxidoreductase GLYR1 homolog n=1 Tax=Daphnia pulicaria TaxID=35523 RepID=UPI001EEBFD10|nr:putative oxidoreductase GLYR1 homolog [Daphnia pulicaria]